MKSSLDRIRDKNVHIEDLDVEGNFKSESKTVTITTESVETVGNSKEIIYVEWEPNDPRNPINFSRKRKWVMTMVACFFTGLAASTTSDFAVGYPSMTRDLSCTNFQATIGLSVFALGFGVAPLVTASFSEEFGRQPLYIASVSVFLLAHVGIGLAKNILTVQIMRFIVGASGSTGATMVGGTIEDIWSPQERGLPMCLFSLAAIGATGLSPVGAGWIEANKHLEWRWVQWIHAIVIGLFIIVLVFGLKETRGGVILARQAKQLRAKTGDPRYRTRLEESRPTLWSLIYVSCTRHIILLLTEPVVASFSIWVGFAWGVTYCLIESISPAFTQLHHFSEGQTGTVFAAMAIGAFLGFLTQFYQERWYQKNVHEKGPEARLFTSMFAGIVMPIGLFIYAWTAFQHVHWLGMTVGITVFMWACFIIYLTVFTYLADCYGTYASSALAGQSLCRNLAGMAFPLFTTQMFQVLTYKWAVTLVGSVAVAMAPIPFILFRWGPSIRARSKFASSVPDFGK